MTSDKYNIIDGIDSRILKILEANGRISISELAQQIKMSAPSVTDRIRRLETRGVIQNFTINVDITKLGFEFVAIVRIKPSPGKMKKVEQMILEQSRFISCDKVTGDDCFVAHLALKSIHELDELLNTFHSFAQTNTSIVHSSLIKNRPVYTKP